VTIQVPVRLTDEETAALDAIVVEGRFASRSDALRAGLTLVLREERQGAIDQAYCRGYGEQPQGDWIGAVGLAGLAAFDQAENDESL
jgi:Arc/MetJ-type ribon-helix-helix transcriptional regulator